MMVVLKENYTFIIHRKTKVETYFAAAVPVVIVPWDIKFIRKLSITI